MTFRTLSFRKMCYSDSVATWWQNIISPHAFTERQLQDLALRLTRFMTRIEIIEW
jgi:hypothetical protein